MLMFTAEAGELRSRQHRDVPTQTSASYSIEEQPSQPLSTSSKASSQSRRRRRPVSTDNAVPAGRFNAEGDQPPSLDYVPERRQRPVRRSVQSSFEPPGPQRTSTPSPIFDRHQQRDAFPTATTTTTTRVVPPPASPPAASKLPRFEPVVADPLPVAAAHARASLHFRKPDVISDVNDEMAEPLRFAPRTDRHRQRQSSVTQPAAIELHDMEQHQLEKPVQLAVETASSSAVATRAESRSGPTSSESETIDDDDDDDDDSSSCDSGTLLLTAAPPITDAPSERQPPATNEFKDLQPTSSVRATRNRVRSRFIVYLYLYLFLFCS